MKWPDRTSLCHNRPLGNWRVLTHISHTPREKCARRAEVEALCASLRGRPEATFRLLRPVPMPSQGIGGPVLISQSDLGCEISRLSDKIVHGNFGGFYPGRAGWGLNWAVLDDS